MIKYADEKYENLRATEIYAENCSLRNHDYIIWYRMYREHRKDKKIEGRIWTNSPEPPSPEYVSREIQRHLATQGFKLEIPYGAPLEDRYSHDGHMG